MRKSNRKNNSKISQYYRNPTSSFATGAGIGVTFIHFLQSDFHFLTKYTGSYTLIKYTFSSWYSMFHKKKLIKIFHQRISTMSVK